MDWEPLRKEMVDAINSEGSEMTESGEAKRRVVRSRDSVGDTEPDEREDIAVALDRVMRLMRRGGKGNRPGRGRAAGRVLRTLEIEGPMVTRDLAKLLDIRLSSLNETLLKLEEEGMILRSRSEMDGRVYLVQLSEKGRVFGEKTRQERRAREKWMASYLTEEERREFVRLCDKLSYGLHVIQEFERLEDLENWDYHGSMEGLRLERETRETILARVMEAEVRRWKNQEDA